MSLLLKSLPVIIALFLGGGYIASLNAALSGTAAEYAARIDVPQVGVLALVLLTICVALAFRPIDEGSEEEEA